jgi:hypothetical protein
MIYQIKLQKGELWRPKELKRGSYKVLSGMAWVTYKGMSEDYVVNHGEALPATYNGMVVEALEDLTLEFQPVSTSISHKFNHWFFY